MTKALREAKVHTSWLSPARDLRGGRRAFRRRDPRSRRANLFLAVVRSVSGSASPSSGIYNSLAQLLIKITAPGVPDFYQGTEFWDLNLVDPDNRRPVDYEHADARCSPR